MGRVIVSEFLTLDGVMQDPHLWVGGVHFKLWNDEGAKFKNDELFAAEALLLGRVTYEAFAAVWPTRDDDDFTRRINSMPKYVPSRTLETGTWNATILKGDLAEEVERLKREIAGDLVVFGSGQLVEALAKAGLVDEYRLWIDPIVVGGSGQRLFTETAPEALFKLVEMKPFATGVTVLIYQPAEEAPAGDEQA